MEFTLIEKIKKYILFSIFLSAFTTIAMIQITSSNKLAQLYHFVGVIFCLFMLLKMKFKIRYSKAMTFFILVCAIPLVYRICFLGGTIVKTPSIYVILYNRNWLCKCKNKISIYNSCNFICVPEPYYIYVDLLWNNRLYNK